MNLRISNTATQQGRGRHLYKTVSNLSQADREHLDEGGTVAFRSAYLSRGLSGTPWRLVVPGFAGRWSPRVPGEAALDAIERLSENS